MKLGSFIVGAAAIAAVALTPSQATAQAAPGCLVPSVTPTLGIGGSLSGCFSFAMSELGENAGYVSSQYYWTGNFGTVGNVPVVQNTPSPTGTQFFDDDCGSSGAPGSANFRFCSGPTYQPSHSVGPIANNSGELVLGLLVPDLVNNGGQPYWVFSGNVAGRNAIPAPDGLQAVLYQLTFQGNPIAGEYLFAWEDLNTGCNALSGNPQYFASEDLGNAAILDSQNHCVPSQPGGWSDADFNDSYIQIHITGGTLSTTPEPMTMTLMATGLVGLAGVQFRRRRKNQG